MTKTLITGWIYCDERTLQPIINKRGSIHVKAEKPTAHQIVHYGARNYQQQEPVIAQKIAVIVPERR